MIETQTRNWQEFYQDRIGLSYQTYFKSRYARFIQEIIYLQPARIIEEGAGIGSISVCLSDTGIQVKGYDNSSEMVHLAKKNVPNVEFYTDNILHPTNNLPYLKTALAVTHGVLEHFSDHEIKQIFARYALQQSASIHYVPLDEYKTPSFGDERLLPIGHWLNLVRPNAWGVFNNGYDLWFYKSHSVSKKY